MKALILLLKQVNFLLKKNFFNFENGYIYHKTKRHTGFSTNVDYETENNHFDEYLKNYTSTTRWQTV